MSLATEPRPPWLKPAVTHDFPDDFLRHLKDASAYAELHMFGDAEQCLLGLPAHLQNTAAALLQWCELEAARHNWSATQTHASALTLHKPEISAGWFWLGYSTRRADSAEAAYSALKPAAGRFPEDPVVDYNFACYAALSGHESDSKEALARVLVAHPRYRHAALEDPDLSTHWTWLREHYPPQLTQA